MSILTAIIAAILSNKLVAGLGAGAIAMFGAWLAGRRKGAKAEQRRQRRARDRPNARIDKSEDAVAGRTADENRDRLKRWGDDK
jgi:hypothetical protein